ncbi:MAG: hypothetical protein KIH89_000045 [Candidatus Shapirobacteria bacterium]|nr:hypothetical protein [Candidatus Shapirobacteria bacterium]
MKRLVLIVFVSLIICSIVAVWFVKLNTKDGIKFNKTKNISKLTECVSLFGVDRQVCDFLNFSSKFSSELIEKKLLSAVGTLPIRRLGLENSSRVEGLLMDFLERDDYIIMLIGFDSKNNERVVVPVKIPIYAINDDNVFFFIRKSEQQNTFSHREDIKLKSKKDVLSYLEKLKGNVIVLMLMDNMVNTESVKDVPLGDSATVSRLITEINNYGVFANRDLLNSVFSNNISVRYKVLDSSLPSIKKRDDISRISNESMPFVLSIIVFLENQ